MTTASRKLKDAAYTQLARIGKAISQPIRVEIVDLLSQRPFLVEELAAELGQPIANVSHHLQILSRERLVERHREGTYIRYRLADGHVSALLYAIRKVAEERLLELEAAVRDFMEQHHAAEPIGLDEFFQRLHERKITVIDVRPEAEYREAHLPGAISLPVEELGSRMAELPRDREVVAYCRGPYCVLAMEAVQRLREAGYQAIQLVEGVPGWLAEGHEIESG